MNRRILMQVTGPAVVIGLLLLATCVVSIWYINRLQADLTNVLEENVRSLKAAQELEIRVRQLRYHNFIYLLDPNEKRLEPIQTAHQQFEEALRVVQDTAHTPAETDQVHRIEAGYRQYHDELAKLRQRFAGGAPRANLGKLADAHPVIRVVEPCEQLLRINNDMMEQSHRQSEAVGSWAQWTMLLLGLLGPVGGLIIGYGVARGLSRSIYQLSVRLQDISHRLDHDVASVSIAADGDIQNLDKQIGQVVLRVEEVAERLQRQQRDMLRAEQLSAVGQLAASVAHEVRNPLTAVKMLVEVALRGQNRKALTVDDLQVIYREIVRLEQTVQGFLDFARLPTPRRTPTDLRQLVSQAVELVQARARQQQVEVAVDCPVEPVTVHIDRGQFSTVLVNLLLNALDAMPRGGRLAVRLEASPLLGVTLDVTDSGSGIAAEVADRLFTPFTSTKPTGTGLGLSISRRIVEEHGGRLTAGNRPEGGARFTIALPASDPSEWALTASRPVPAVGSRDTSV
ncbi:MAG TPA: ATP-binding protein [Gemmataceae bacterium]|jgi:signal transduction histidine kinase|nr:ATP-binding protein [Gemmataceae bacterium]